MRTSALLPAVLALAACQPQARRLLLLDEALTQEVELDATARPWQDAGYRVEYRRYYPHLTRADLDHYRVVLILGGRRPAVATDALDIGDLAILTEWTLRGGVVVLGYPPEGDGTLDRWLMNRWLAWSGAGITIGDFALQDTARGGGPPLARAMQTAGLRGTGFDLFPVGASDPLLVGDETQALARVGDGAVVRSPGHPAEPRDGAAIAAASRLADGLIIVLSRPALATLGPSDSLGHAAARPSATAGTRAFLTALARWTRRPAEWARIPAAGARARLDLTGGPLPVAPRPPRAAPPPGVTAERLVKRGPPDLPHPTTGVPGWVTRQGMRALQGDFPALRPTTPGTARLAALDSLSRLLDIGAFNTLATNAHVAPLVDSSAGQRWERDALRAAWAQVTGRLQSTSVHWVPLVLPGELTPPDSSTGERCPLDPASWGRLASGLRVLARLAAGHADLIPAIGVVLDQTAQDWGGPALCDAAWQAALGALPRDTTLTAQRVTWLNAVPLPARYDSLLESGLLAAYDAGLARVVAQRAAALRAEVRRIRRDLLFALVLDRSPADWLTRSLVRGLSAPDAPVFVFSPDPRTRALFAAAGDVSLLHAIRLDPSLLLPGGVAGLGRAVFDDQDGFWVGPAEALLTWPSDTLARQVRRLNRDR